ncbi:MAG: hypothetical protein RL614_709, partial [Pseudomonadota bacterium]
MIERIVRFALQQRLLVVVICVCLFFVGLFATKRLSVDAFPDVTNIQVQIATEAPGKSPEEVERFVTIPIELEEVERFVTIPIELGMTGLPGLVEMRSLNRNGISIVTLVFTEKTSIYFARQLVLERLIEVASRMPDGITPVLAPPTTGLGEVYQYTLEHPSDRDRPLTEDELQERRTIQDWVVRPMLRSIPGVAEINTQGGFAKEYQVLVNPERLRHYGITLQDVYLALARNNANSGGGQLPTYAERYLIRGVGLVAKPEDIGKIILKEIKGTPVYVRNVAEVMIGNEIRQGAIIKNGVTEGVAGIIQMNRGANAREVVNRIKDKVADINERKLLPEG